jgi:LacI family transcriptional regulator, repressor for deo operon, udp, cdd, tsx, nupC, and nupG
VPAYIRQPNNRCAAVLTPILCNRLLQSTENGAVEAGLSNSTRLADAPSSIKAPRMKEVAHRAGVSTATVSRALSNPERVSAEVRGRVLQAVADLDYTLNAAARTLRRSNTGIVLVLVPDIGNPFFSKVLKGIEQRARELSYSVLIGEAGDDNGQLETFARQIDAKRADGMILLNGRLPDFMSKRAADVSLPVVAASEWIAGAALPSVGIDNVAAALGAVRHLQDHGHRHIAHIAGPLGNVLSAARLAGYRAALGAGIKPRVAQGDFSITSGQIAARTLMAARTPPTALFAANDEMAMGAIVALKALGLSVPGDVSVAGFDDIDFAAAYDPPLTTVRQPRFEMGRVAMSLLDSRLRGEDAVDPVLLPTALIVRDSTASP